MRHRNTPMPADIDGSRELVYRFRWSLTQVAVLSIGIFLMVLGGIGLARAGAEGISSPTDPAVAVALWTRTPLMAIIEIVAGLLLIVEGAQPKGSRVNLRLAGSLTLVFGIVVGMVPDIFDTSLGTGRATGGLYGLIGVVLLGLGFGAPIVFERDTVQALDEGYDDDYMEQDG